jgi:exonuclease SbcD
MLNAPKAILKSIDIHVLGGGKTEPENYLIPISEKNEVKVVIAMIPFLRDAELRKVESGASYDEVQNEIREGISAIYQEIVEVYKKYWDGIPLIGMGHLFAQGAQPGEAERDIQIGNLAAFDSDQFPEAYDYVALGHIHKPQVLRKDGRVQYSGSPISLSFSERTDEKRMVILEVDRDKDLLTSHCPIPKFRNLVKIKGDFEQIREKLDALKQDRSILPTLVELHLEEERPKPGLMEMLQSIVEQAQNEQLLIVKSKVTYEKQVLGTDALFSVGDKLNEISITEVFEKRMSEDQIPQEDKSRLLAAFTELLDEVQN